jgi:HlyD family secretion protein
MAQNSCKRMRLVRRGGMLAATLVAVVVVLIVVAASVFMLGGPGDGTASDSAGTAELAPAERGSFDIITLAMGELEAKNRIEIRNRMNGRATIVEIIPEGTTVEQGDLLVRLDSDAIKDEIASEELALDEAKAQLLAAETALEIQQSENDSRLRKADLQVELSMLSLKQWQEGDLVKMLKDQKLAIEQAERQVERLKAKTVKNEDLLKKQFISKDQYDLDNIALIDAQATLAKAVLTSEVYEKYQKPRDEKQKISDLAEAKAELDRVVQENEINLNSRQATMSNRQRQAERRQQRLDEYRQQLEYSTVLAPSPGLVVYGSTVQKDGWRMSSEGPLQIGRQVGPNDLLIVLPDTEQMVAKVKVHESLAGKIHSGLEAMISVEAVGRHDFRGTVESVGVMAEGGGWRDPNLREYSVRITLNQDQETLGLKPSMRAEARILLGKVEDVIHVPIQAVFIDGPVTFVYKPRGAKFARLPVRLGQRSDTRAEITSGLEPGDLVLLRTPSPGEIILEPWDKALLKAAGYAFDDQGNPVSNASKQRPRNRQQSRRPKQASG